MKKICSKCKNEKFLNEFNKKSESKDGLNSQCRECNKEYLKNHYINNKEYYYNKSKEKRKKLKEWFINYKKNLKCIKCGEDREWVLDFHHRDPSKKDNYVINLLYISGKSKTLKEIKKCDVLCANCHRDVHYHMKLI